MTLGLTMVLAPILIAAATFHGNMVLEEGTEQSGYRLDLKSGILRVEPEGEEVYFLVDVDSRRLTFVHSQERFYSHLSPEGFRRLLHNGTVRAAWFPWVCRVSSDLVQNLEFRQQGGFRLPDGRKGIHIVARSSTYDRVLAEYWLDPDRPADLFFQWRKIYMEFWGTGEPEEDEAQRARLEFYEDLPGFPVKLEERFGLLTRARSMRFTMEGALPEAAFTVPEDFVERTEPELLWEGLLRRFERWIRPEDTAARRQP